MHRIILFGCLLLALIVASVESQDDNYRIWVPTVEEYIRAAPAIIEQVHSEDYQTYFRIRMVMSQEFNLRYGDTDLTELSFDLLIDFQTALAIGADILLVTDEREWFKGMLKVGLADVQLSDISEGFTTGNFDVVSTSINLEGDNTQEYLLEVHDVWSRRRFYALAGESLQMLPLPIIGLPGDLITRRLAASGELSILDIADLDGDGDDEIIVEGDQYGYWASCGDLYVLDWLDGGMIDRTDELFSYCLPLAQVNTGSVMFSINQADAIQMIETRIDGWNCQRVRTDTLNMLDDTLETQTVYADTAWCDLREAGEAFDDGNYAAAAGIYTSALPNFEGQMEQYLLARLVLSFALDGQTDRALSILEMTEPVGQMGDLLLRLQPMAAHPEEMCYAAYDFFAEINRTQENPHANPYEWTPPNFYFGREFQDPRYYPLPDPAQAACDYRQIYGSVSTPVPMPENAAPDIWSFVNFHVYQHLTRGEYEQVLSQIEIIYTLPTANYEDYALQLRYWRALALEALNRPDEALAEYIAIYEAAPESAWGMLAALHLEVVDH